MTVFTFFFSILWLSSHLGLHIILFQFQRLSKILSHSLYILCERALQFTGFLSRHNRLLSLPKHPDHLWGLPSLLFNEWAKQPGHKVDDFPPSAEDKNEWRETSLTPHAFIELRQTYLIIQLVKCSCHFCNHSQFSSVLLSSFLLSKMWMSQYMVELVMFHFVSERGLKNLRCGFVMFHCVSLLMPHLHNNR